MDKASILWVLEHWDYAQALAIYLRSGHASKVKASILQQQSPFNAGVLRAELAKIAALPDAPPAQQREAKEQLADFYQLPREVQELITERNSLRKDNDFDFIQMVATPEDKACPELAKNIVSRAKRIAELQTAIDHFYTNGKLPEVKKPPAPNLNTLSNLDLLRRRNTLRTYISRTKDVEKKKVFQTELDEIQNRLQHATGAE